MALRPIARTDEKKTQRRETERFSKILYVEDEDMNWTVTERRLRDTYLVTRAADARLAFMALARERFDLILMDIQLAGSELDGIQITQILRGACKEAVPEWAVSKDETKDVPIVFVTAYGSRYDRDTLIELGGNDVITKPVNFAALAGCITRILLRAVRES